MALSFASLAGAEWSPIETGPSMRWAFSRLEPAPDGTFLVEVVPGPYEVLQGEAGSIIRLLNGPAGQPSSGLPNLPLLVLLMESDQPGLLAVTNLERGMGETVSLQIEPVATEGTRYVDEGVYVPSKDYRENPEAYRLDVVWPDSPVRTDHAAQGERYLTRVEVIPFQYDAGMHEVYIMTNILFRLEPVDL